MNSYGSVAHVSRSIYNLLQYMNWVSNDIIEPNASGGINAVDEMNYKPGDSNRNPI